MEENKVMQDESVFLFWMGKQKEGWNEKTGLYHRSQQGETEGGLPLSDNCWNTET